MSKRMILLLSTWGYLGKIPKAPGTFGTLGAIPLVLVLSMTGEIPYMLAALCLVVGSVLIAHLHELRFGVHDASEIVIDEVAGFVVAMTWLPMSWQSFVIAFIVFRALDILKPFPISYLDKNIKGGLGVVADDILAGVVTNFVLQMIYTQTSFLGEQLVI